MGERHEIVAAHALEEAEAEEVVLVEAARLGLAFALRHGRGYAPDWHEAGLERTVEVVVYGSCRREVEVLAARLGVAFDQDAVLVAAGASHARLVDARHASRGGRRARSTGAARRARSRARGWA